MSDPSKNYGDPTPASTAYIGLIGVIIFVLTLIYLETLYYNSEEQQRIEKVVNEPIEKLENHIEAQREILRSYSYEHDYADGAGRVSIPIDEAVERLLREWPAQPGAPSDSGTASRGSAADDTQDDQGAAP